MTGFADSVDAYSKALLRAPNDAQLLADFADALAMTRGQETLDISLMARPEASVAGGPPARPAILAVVRASDEERAAFAASFLAWSGMDFSADVKAAAFQVPLLVLTGEHDPITPGVKIDQQASRPHEADHDPVDDDDPDDFIDTIA